MKKIFSALLAIFCILTMVFAVSCSKNEKYSYWLIDKLVDDTSPDDSFTQGIKVSLSKNDVKEFWINISNLSVEESTLSYVFGTSTSLKYYTVSRAFLNNSDGWYKVSVSSSLTTLRLYFVDSMRVNEIVFINDDDKVMEFTFEEFILRPSVSSNSEKCYTKEEIETLVEEKKNVNGINYKHSQLCAFDEQERFNLEEATAAYNKAEDIRKAQESTATDSNS